MSPRAPRSRSIVTSLEWSASAQRRGTALSQPTPAATLANGRRMRRLWCERCAGRRGVARRGWHRAGSVCKCAGACQDRQEERSSLAVRRANAAAVSYPVRAPVKTETSGRGLAPAKASWTSLRPRYGPIEPACLRMSKKRMTRCRQRQPKSRSKTNPALPASASPSPTASPALAPSTPLPVIADLPMQRRHETASSCHGNLRPANYSYAHVPFDRTRKL
jgi:hypothetical protein